MTGLIAPVPMFPPRREPSIVTSLRQQIARSASDVVLHRIAGSSAEYVRLAAEYKLRSLSALKVSAAAAALPPSEPPPLTAWERRARLMALVLEAAQGGHVFPETTELALTLGAATLAIEQDLLALVRDGRIRVSSMWCGARAVRRVELLGRNLFTALPTLDRARGVSHGTA